MILAFCATCVLYGGAALSMFCHRVLADSRFGKSEVGWSMGLILLLVLSLLVLLMI